MFWVQEPGGVVRMYYSISVLVVGTRGANDMSQPMTLAGSSSTASYNTHSLLSVPSEAINLRDN